MGGKRFANQGMTIQVVPPASGQVTVLSMPSLKSKACGKGIYRGPLQFMVSNITAPGLGLAVPGILPAGVIVPTAATSVVDGMPPVRLGDRIDGLTAVGAMNPGPSGPVPVVIVFSVEITDAGQTEITGG